MLNEKTSLRLTPAQPLAYYKPHMRESLPYRGSAAEYPGNNSVDMGLCPRTDQNTEMPRLFCILLKASRTVESQIRNEYGSSSTRLHTSLIQQTSFLVWPLPSTGCGCWGNPFSSRPQFPLQHDGVNWNWIGPTAALIITGLMVPCHFASWRLVPM